jgi:hypothetical protein
MRERGGPGAQSGFYYQNSVAALYLGALCRPEAVSVGRVRIAEWQPDGSLRFTVTRCGRSSPVADE